MKKILSLMVMMLLLSIMTIAQTKCDNLCWTSRFVFVSGFTVDYITSRELVSKHPEFHEGNFLVRDSRGNVSLTKALIVNGALMGSLEYLSKTHRKLARGLMIGTGAAHFIMAAWNIRRNK